MNKQDALTIRSAPSFSLVCRLLWREWRSGELRLLLIALLIAVTASSAVGFFTDRVERGMVRQATEFLGADLVLRTARPFQLDLSDQAQQLDLRYSEQLIFASMLIQGDDMLLTTIKTVDDQYPLKGEVKIDIQARPNAASSHQLTAKQPSPGKIWLEPRALETLKLNIGDSVELGAAEFEVQALLLHEPDRGGGWLSLRPRAMINQQDIAKTEVIQPGSRVHYRYLFNGSEANIDRFRQWLEPKLNPGERILDLRRENPSLGKTLSRAQSYLNLSGLLAVMMASIAIAMAARRYSERHFDTAALLRSLGQSQRQIITLYGLQIVIAGSIVSFLGVACGWLSQHILIKLFSGLIPSALPNTGLTPGIIGFATGMLVLLGFTLPPLLRLGNVSPLRVLRRDLDPTSASSWLIYGLGGGILGLLLWSYSGDIKLTLIVIGFGSILAFVLGFVAWLSIKLLSVAPGPLPWRLAIKNLRRHPGNSFSQLFAFGLTLTAMALILVVRSELISTWQEQLPDQAPNNFLINIQPWQVDQLEGFFADNNIQHSGIFPMVRGRLSQINGKSADQVLAPKSHGRRAINRELNLSFSDRLAEDNRIESGRWWQPQDKGKAYISVEQDLAKDLGVGLGDQLSFTFADRTLSAEILSLRSLDWGSLRPNFYVIFPPSSLAELPASHITSFFLEDERSPLLTELIQNFPTLTLLEVDKLLGAIRSIVEQVSVAVEYIMLFVLAAGATVMFAALASSIDERLQEAALIRALGGNRKTLSTMLNIEFILVGFLAGLMAAMLTEAISWWLYRALFGLQYQPNLLLWLLTPLAGAAIVTFLGRWGTISVLNSSPLNVLRNR